MSLTRFALSEAGLVGPCRSALSGPFRIALSEKGMSAAKTLVGPCWKGLVGGLVLDKVFDRRLFCRMSAAKTLVGPCRRPCLGQGFCWAPVLKDVCGENRCRALSEDSFAGFALSDPCRQFFIFFMLVFLIKYSS